ncbi:hypothetical protein BGZ70_006762 [Mortierella alpina]|uniref:Zf-CHY-domain-containing protein n=1 Tax=Mortierella alpina TaxID=64518 RepID=A0A9P6JAT7_MORAP|nr:hypothetical protein BGZ70_006762 [Mortierella alpina]
MASPPSHSRTSSIYVDAPEFSSGSSEAVLPPINDPSQQQAALSPLRRVDPEQDDDNDEDEVEHEEAEADFDSDDNDVDDTTQDGSQDDEELDEGEIQMEVDPVTGLQRATLLTWRSRQARSSSLTSRLRRQQRQLSRARLSYAERSERPDRPSSQAGAGSGSSRSAGSSRGGTNPVTASSPPVDEKAQSELRRKIMDIQRNPDIGFADKASMIQEGQLGCQHYRRGCKLKANCCGKWFNCRFCHDDASDHAIIRNETKMMLCMHCKTPQTAAQSCSSCNAQLAKYYCDVCKLWDDHPEKAIYHCVDCGICRIGNGLGIDFFHCIKCNICMNIHLKDNHKCIERNLECDCPICGEYMFTSTTTVIFMPCGHCIHSTCHDDYIKTSYQCPTCWKALGDMSTYYAKIDSLLADQTMPPEYANIFSIVLCNDCEVKSEAPYHFLYHKCDKCKGYNTKVLETFKRILEGQTQVIENATASGAAGTAPENNISGGSSSAVTVSSGSGSASGVGAGGGSSSNSAAAGPITMTTTVYLPEAPRSPLLEGNTADDVFLRDGSNPSGNSAP